MHLESVFRCIPPVCALVEICPAVRPARAALKKMKENAAKLPLSGLSVAEGDIY